MTFKIERVMLTGIQTPQLKVKPRGQEKKNGNYHLHEINQRFFWQSTTVIYLTVNDVP